MPIRFLSAPLRAYRQTEFTKCLSLVLLFMVLATPAFAQGIRFGVKGGVPISEYFDSGSRYSSATRRYTLGPSVEVTVWEGLSLEFDALYKRIGYAGGIVRTFTRQPPFYTDTFDVKGSSWDFPLMVKYRLSPFLPLYVAGGGIVRHIGPVRERGVRTGTRLVAVDGRPVSMMFSEPIDTSDPSDLRKRTWPGLTVSGGIEFGRGRFRVLPEFRFTRLTSNINDRLGTLRFEPNQVEFLLGFLF